jgi:tight adherence protein C
MILVLLLALGLVGLAVALVFRAQAGDSVRGQETLTNIRAYGFKTHKRESATGRHQRLNQLADTLGEIYSRHAGEEREAQVLELLRSAGLYRMRAVTFVGYRVLATLTLSLFFLWLLSVAGAQPLAVFFLAVVFGAIGWIAPLFILRQRAATRLESIDLEVPELVDLLVTTVEAGIGFTAALQITARRIEGPLGEELRVALSEQNMGLTISEALANMLGRANTPALRMFVQAILQGETLGVSIGKILRELAIDMRKRRRQAAEERAQKAPTKIIFPLVLLILPALFIVCVGPFIMSFIHSVNNT